MLDNSGKIHRLMAKLGHAPASRFFCLGLAPREPVRILEGKASAVKDACQ